LINLLNVCRLDEQDNNKDTKIEPKTSDSKKTFSNDRIAK